MAVLDDTAAALRRPAWAEIDLGAVRHNVELMAALVAPAHLCVVVKADGYGHGAVPVARAALEAGASWLAVAIPAEGACLRAAGIEAPVLVLSEPSPDEMDDVVAHRLRPALYSAAAIDHLARAVSRAGAPPVPVHLKVDTGMHRVGAAPGDVPARAAAVSARPELHLEAVWTHCAVADQPDHPFTAEQLARLDGVLAGLAISGIRPDMVHAANSAAAIAHPWSRRDMVRVGIATYGLAPSPALAGRVALRPAMAVKARVSHVAVVAAGQGVSYGLHHTCSVDTVVATVPLGYADGVPRRLPAQGGAVLVGGRRRSMVGVVTMDQLMIDCGPPGGDRSVAVGDEAVLIGEQSGGRITADEWAERLGTISYEVVCGISPRVPRHYRG